MKSEFIYYLALKEESIKLYNKSLQALVDSDCIQYTVYKIRNANNLSDIKELDWLILIEIDDTQLKIIETNFHQKLRAAALSKLSHETSF